MLYASVGGRALTLAVFALALARTLEAFALALFAGLLPQLGANRVASLTTVHAIGVLELLLEPGREPRLSRQLPAQFPSVPEFF